MAQNVIDHLIEDHDKVRDLFSRYDSTAPGEVPALFNQIVEELARHETAEEMVVYPVLRSEVDDGDRLADARISEEQEAEETLAELEDLGADHPEFDTKFRALRDDVLRHAEKEETEVFPRLRQALSDERLEDLGKWFQRAESMAPTHPHPNAPDTPPGNVVLGPVAAVFDRARDLFENARSR